MGEKEFVIEWGDPNPELAYLKMTGSAVDEKFFEHQKRLLKHKSEQLDKAIELLKEHNKLDYSDEFYEAIGGGLERSLARRTREFLKECGELE
jgi:hypothetical protein